MAVAATAAPSVSAGLLLDIVERTVHAARSEWLFLRELKLGTGKRNGSLQRVDGFALNTLPHTAMKRVCYEVKTSRADFLCELRNPLKRRVGMWYSNEFYFLMPAGICRTEEVPEACGLVEAGVAAPEEWRELVRRAVGYFHYDADTGAYCMVVVPAPWWDTPGPTWQLVAAMVRNQRREVEGPLPVGPRQERMRFD